MSRYESFPKVIHAIHGQCSYIILRTEFSSKLGHALTFEDVCKLQAHKTIHENPHHFIAKRLPVYIGSGKL